MDDIKAIGKLLAEAVVDAIERLDERQEDMRDRWFETGEDGVKREVVEKYVFLGEEYDWRRIGVEKPARMVLKRAKSSIKTDFKVIKDKTGIMKFVPTCFAGKEEDCEYSLEVEFENDSPARGLMALHQRAGDDIADDARLQTQVASLDTKVEGEDEDEESKKETFE